MSQNRAACFATLLQRFCAEHLPTQRGLSRHTVQAYRDTFRLLLGFLARHRRVPPDRVELAALTPETILAFLDHLERDRRNSVRTRNARLAAIRAFARFVLGETAAAEFAQAHRLLTIPLKRTTQPVPGFLTREEVDAILAATDASTTSGQRDRLLFTVLYNTGARISEALQLRPVDLEERALRLHGKGRKERCVPLWPQTMRRLRQWCRRHRLATDQLIFTNRCGLPLTRDGVAYRLTLAACQAQALCPSLAGKRVTPHLFRHATAMSLLQSGVALEVIALWLGHARPGTTHTYVEADMKMKAACLRRLEEPKPPGRFRREEPSRLLSFLRAL